MLIIIYIINTYFCNFTVNLYDTWFDCNSHRKGCSISPIWTSWNHITAMSSSISVKYRPHIPYKIYPFYVGLPYVPK